MYYKNTVKIPLDSKKVVFQKRKDQAYVLFEVEREYSEEKKYTFPKRVMIGKRCTEDATLMHPNDKYYQIFPDAPQVEEHEEVERSCCLKIGSYAVINQIYKDYGLDKILQKRFGDNAGLFMDLASYLIVKENNAGQYYPDYAFDHPLFTAGMSVLSDSAVSKFFKEVNLGQIYGFLDDWNAREDKASRIYISYDSTNKNSQAGDIDIVEFGKAKDEKGLPIFNLSIAFNTNNEKPLFYETYPGSINDVSQFKFVVDKALEYKYCNIGFILDRGYYSRSNIEYMDKNNFAFVIMANGCKTLVSKLILEHKGSFETARENTIRGLHLNAITIKTPLYKGDEKSRYMHLFFSPKKMAEDRKSLEDRLEQMVAMFDKVIGKEFVPTQLQNHYFTFHYDNEKRLVYASEKSDVVEHELDLSGYFCLITSEKMTAEEAYRLYKGRDASEKLFRADKSFLGSKSMRVHTPEATEAKLLVEFVALIIRNRIYVLLREEMAKLQQRKNFMTVPAAIRELEKIEMVRRNNGQYRLDHAVTRTQKTILNSFGLSEDDIRLEAARIAKDLAKGVTQHD